MRRIILVVLVCSLLLGWPASHALANFPIDLKTDMNDEDVQASTMSSGNTTILELANNTSKKMFCEATFRTGPDFPKVRKQSIEPMKKVILNYTSSREIIRMKVDVKCRPR